MYDKIAVTQNENNEITTLERCSKVQVFTETDDGWQFTAEIPWQIGNFSNPADVRGAAKALSEEMKDCRIMISGKIAGLPYHVFEKSGFQLFEADCPVTQELFKAIKSELIASDIKQSEFREASAKIPQKPYSPEKDGIYYLNLIELQQAFPEISSKKALKQFIDETSFLKLNLVCNHVPPWIEDAALQKGLQTEVRKLDDGVCSVVISQKK